MGVVANEIPEINKILNAFLPMPFIAHLLDAMNRLDSLHINLMSDVVEKLLMNAVNQKLHRC